MIKELAIQLHLWSDKVKAPVTPEGTANADNKVLVNRGWYETALKHYCGTCEQWFKTASIATHNRFKHKDA